MRQEEHIARTREIPAITAENPEKNSLLGRSRNRWEYNFKIDLK